MMFEWNQVASFLGGVGFFLLGMHLLTEGLKLAAGRALIRILSLSTRTTFHGILTGTLITAFVQSSSAVTLGIIGFVNAGLLNLKQAITVVYGSNLGTTMTSWLVALLGFKINIDIFSLPLIFIGMFLHILGRDNKIAFWGQVFVGFGLLFVGIDFLKTTFMNMGDDINLASVVNHNGFDTVLFLLIGFLMTVLMQSSSAAIAVIITAATSGVLSLELAASMVIGANIGTTTTAVIAVIGATPNAKRVAAAHILFNVLTATVAIIILSVMLQSIEGITSILHLENSPAFLLALFHTSFNLLGVILILPFSGKMVAYLKNRFRSIEEDESRPRYLDYAVIATPSLAFEALVKELLRLKTHAYDVARVILSSDANTKSFIEREKLILTNLVDEIAKFNQALVSRNLSEDISLALPNGLRIAHYFLDIIALAEEINLIQQTKSLTLNDEMNNQIINFKKLVIAFINHAESIKTNYVESGIEKEMQAINDTYQAIKVSLLTFANAGSIEVHAMVNQMEVNSCIRRIAKHIDKACRYFSDLNSLVQIQKND